MLKKTLKRTLDCKEIQSVHPKGDQSWVFIGGTDFGAGLIFPLLWPPDAKTWLIGKTLMLGKIEGRRRRRWQRMRWLDGKCIHVSCLSFSFKMMKYNQPWGQSPLCVTTSLSVGVLYLQSHIWHFCDPLDDNPPGFPVGFPREVYWNGLSFPSPEDLPDPEIKATFPASLALAGRFFWPLHPWKSPSLQDSL